MSDCFVVLEIQGIFWGRAIFHLNTTKAKIFWKQYDVSSKRKENVSVRKNKNLSMDLTFVPSEPSTEFQQVLEQLFGQLAPPWYLESGTPSAAN